MPTSGDVVDSLEFPTALTAPSYQGGFDVNQVDLNQIQIMI